MTTLASEQIRWMADQIENHCGYDSAVLSGILPDQRHLERGGFHCSVEDLLRFGNGDDYSNTRPDDRNRNPKYGAAVDMSMSKADMVKAHKRFMAVWSDRTDPRRMYLNCINGWDGDGDAVRVDFYANMTSYASPDHKWHNHIEVRRRWVLTWLAVRAIVSVFKGETKIQWLAYLATVEGPTPPTTPAPPVPAPKPLNWTEKIVKELGTLRRDSTDREAVQTWQAALCARGVVADGNWKAYCDGGFGKRTEADTKELQRKYGLKPDGIVGPLTWAVGLTGKRKP